MNILSSSDLEYKIKNISQKLSQIAKNQNGYHDYVDQNIKSENLKYNLSLLFSHIILKLQFADRSINTLKNGIKKYNRKHLTDVDFNEYIKLGWIRIINNEIIIPSQIQSLLLRDFNKPKAIPTHIKPELIYCLLDYYNDYWKGKLTIRSKDIKDVLNVFAPLQIDIAFLLDKNVIKKSDIRGYYIWFGHNEYTRHLRNEISATLWLLVAEMGINEEVFRKYIKTIIAIDLWPDNLNNYLTPLHTQKIHEFSFNILTSENDLLTDENEFNKIWYDSYHYDNGYEDQIIPYVRFKESVPSKIIHEVEYHEFRFHDLFHYQGSRNFYSLLIDFVIQFDKSYSGTIKLLKAHDRLYLVWSTYQKIIENYPQVIPFLLSDLELIELHFKLILDIKLNITFLPYRNNGNTFSDEQQIKNEIFLDLFDLILDRLPIYHHEEAKYGEIIYLIIQDISKRVFKSIRSNGFQIETHYKYKELYSNVFQILCNKRILNVRSFSTTFIQPRLLFNVLKGLIQGFSNHTTQIAHTAFIGIDMSYIDMGSKLLKLINTQKNENEGVPFDKDSLRNIVLEKVENHILDFFSENKVHVISYGYSETEERKSNRSLTYHGYELISWGNLFLYFQNKDRIKHINVTIQSKIEFIHSPKGTYDEHNKEETEKLKHYLKILMLAYIDIQEHKSQFEFEDLPINKTLIALEDLIIHYSKTYSIDNINAGLVDIFTGNYYFHNNDIYYQSLISLLYKCINYLSIEKQVDFIAEFFAHSNDIGKMLKAINSINAKEVKEIISNKINSFNLKEFIKSQNYFDFKSTLIDAVNSESHWHLAESLIVDLQEYYKKIRQYEGNTENLFFEINLLLAFKKKDTETLEALKTPGIRHNVSPYNEEAENLKSFYIALDKLYNYNKYEEAIELLESLTSKDTHNIRFALNLYRARIQKALE